MPAFDNVENTVSGVVKVGRPTVYDPEIAGRICERLAKGENLRGFCVWPDWPTKSTVLRWVKENPEFGKQYCRILRNREKREFGTSTRDHAPARVGGGSGI